MLGLAPPVKVARTQRLNGSMHGGSFATREGGHSSLARPTNLEDTVMMSGGAVLSPSVFLSGVGRHMAWLVDENQKLVRLWNLSNPGWSRTEPRMAQIPFFAATEEGLPLFVSEMGEQEQSLAFCSERGTVSSLDHSVEFQLLDGDETVTASCFACTRRVDCGDVVLTVVGTTAGALAVDVKENGAHVTLRFDRLTATGKTLPPLPPSLTDDAGRSSQAAMRRSCGGKYGSGRVPGLWDSVWTFLTRGRTDGGDDKTPRPATVTDGDCGSVASSPPSASTVYRGDGTVAELTDDQGLTRAEREGLAFTHAIFRDSYPRELVTVNAASELMLLEMGSSTLAPRWATNVQAAVERVGYVVAVAETRHRVTVLYLSTASTDSRAGPSALPVLILATFSSSQGKLIHFVQLNAIADVVKAVAEVPRHHVKLYVHDSNSHAIVFVRHFCVRVNIQVGVRSPCLSADTSVVEGVESPLCTLMRADGSAVTLGVEGPVSTWEGLWDSQPPPVLSRDSDRSGTAFFGSPAPSSDADVEKRIADIVKVVQADGGRLTLDTAVLHASEDIFAQRRSHHSNWARADLDAEDENLVLYVTKDLRRRQQLHRRFLVALLHNEYVVSQLQPTTIAQLISSQEALLSQVALRGLQNVGVLAPSANPLLMLPTSLATLSSVPRPVCFDDTLLSADGAEAPSSGGATAVKLLETVEQVERCQQLLRRAILGVANGIREGGGGGGPHRGQEDDPGAIHTATAVELVFSHPHHAVALLRQMGECLLETLRSAAVDGEAKCACAYAAACIFVIVAQTIVESRENLKETYPLPPKIRRHLWTASEDAACGVQLAFTHICTTLSSALADAVQTPPLQQSARRGSGGNEESTMHSAPPGTFTDRVVTVAAQAELLDLIGYLLHFCFSSTGVAAAQLDSSCGGGGGDPPVSALLKQTLLREPFVVEPYGYPFGPPTAASHIAEVSARALRMAEALATHFDGVEVLLAFSLATPTEDPQPAHYTKLQAYCQRNPRMLSFALDALWQWRREWELLCLPSVLPHYAPTATTRDAFLELQAPHLLWLAAPSRFDALAREGTASPPYVPYGPTALSHRSRCLSMSKLAWIAGGAHTSSRHDALTLDASLVACQQRFLSPQCDSMVLGLQDLVQRLLSLEGNVPAWVGAARVAVLANTDLAEDLVVQVMRRCKAYDGDALVRLYQDSASELETMRAMKETAVGEVIGTCAPLQHQGTLKRICQTVLAPEEFHIVSSWLAAMWSGEGRV